jgi:ABC-type lipoprotein export system ATPase subunit
MVKGLEPVRLEVTDLSLTVPGRELFSDVSFAVDAGECVAVVGSSGVGKTSLLNCIAGITTPTSGSVVVDGSDLRNLRAPRRAEFRLRHIGIVFQFGELFPELTALENVALPLRLIGVERPEAETRAADWLERLGVDVPRKAHPELLSGGEIQRIAIARALVLEPLLVLADEPTGMLDEENTERVAGLLVNAAKGLGAAVVVATHDSLVAAAADRVLGLRAGALVPASESGVLEQARR